MPHDNAALMREAARELEIYENGPVRLATRLRAAADALAAGGEDAPFDDAVQTLDRIRGAAQHCECQSYELAHACMSRHNGFNAARRAEEPRHD